jgi:NADH dehydrogenase
MANPIVQAVTGAFGYSGRYIAKHLLARSKQVITFTNTPNQDDIFSGKVKAFPLSFDQPNLLARNLRGVQVLYNTYWVRFNHREFNFKQAVRNSITLIEAAQEAGVERIVHVSITNPSTDSPLEYFRGKAEVEEAIKSSGISYSILRPTVMFGKEDILINNIAWALRNLPVFGVFGDGQYCLQPIYVDDLAALAAEQGEASSNQILDVIGPEKFSYRSLVETISQAIRVKRPIISVSPTIGLLAGWLLGVITDDVLITRQEIQGLMAGLLCSDAQPTGDTNLSTWAMNHAATLGKQYASELVRRRR